MVTENDTYDNSDSDCDDRHGSKTLSLGVLFFIVKGFPLTGNYPINSPTASPFNQTPNHGSYSNSEKLQLCIDYWSEDKEGKQSAKETLRSIEFTPLKQYIKV